MERSHPSRMSCMRQPRTTLWGDRCAWQTSVAGGVCASLFDQNLGIESPSFGPHQDRAGQHEAKRNKRVSLSTKAAAQGRRGRHGACFINKTTLGPVEVRETLYPSGGRSSKPSQISTLAEHIVPHSPSKLRKRAKARKVKKERKKNVETKLLTPAPAINRPRAAAVTGAERGTAEAGVAPPARRRSSHRADREAQARVRRQVQGGARGRLARGIAADQDLQHSGLALSPVRRTVSLVIRPGGRRLRKCSILRSPRSLHDNSSSVLYVMGIW
ncbi:hypothetical protein GGS24DRAFT_46472 [Hypoxylon argillaceum]|nr:hypothetical protein GGS24DRAFT_46472 [Hypoxylon argillaceum]